MGDPLLELVATSRDIIHSIKIQLKMIEHLSKRISELDDEVAELKKELCRVKSK